MTGFDGVLTWRFRARNVRDFDWGASPKYLWDATVAVVGDRDGDGKPDTTSDQHVLPAGGAHMVVGSRRREYERSVVEFLSNYLWPYPWPQMTALEGPVSCTGMEYPMLTCIGGPRDTLLALLGAGPRDGAHVVSDAGRDRTSGATRGRTRGSRASIRRRGCRRSSRATTARDRRARAISDLARTDGEVPLMRHGDQYPYDTRGVQRRVVRQDGDEHASRCARCSAIDAFSRRTARTGCAGSTSIRRHTTSSTRFNSLAGRDLSWFWRTWWYETWTLDQAIGAVQTVNGKLDVTIEDRGLAPMPVRLAITRRDGRVERREIPVDVWLTGAKRYSLTLDAPETVTSIEIDPEHAFPDIDRSNNKWTRR